MNNQIKILIATGIYPPDLGGPATLMTALPAALKDRGLSVKVITYSDVAASDQELREGTVFRISRHQSSFCRQAKYFWRLWRLAYWCDVIYVTDTYSVGYFAYLIKKIIGKKYVIRFAGDSAWETAVANAWADDYIIDFQNKKYNVRIERLKKRRTKVLLGANKVVAVSNFMGGLARTVGVAEGKIRVIYNAVDFFGDWPAKVKPAVPTLVFAGRLMPWKGVAALLRVLAKLKKEYPDIIFEILGDGPEEENLKKTVKDLGLEQNVKFFGRVSEEKSHTIFAQASLFVLNTNYEGLPHSVLNAMACGLPVITTPLGGNTEVVADGVNGRLVPYNDESAWQAAISRLLADEELQEKFVQNSQKTLERFKWEKLVDETVALLDEVVQQ